MTGLAHPERQRWCWSNGSSESYQSNLPIHSLDSMGPSRPWRLGGSSSACGSPVTPRSGVTGTARPTLRFAVANACADANPSVGHRRLVLRKQTLDPPGMARAVPCGEAAGMGGAVRYRRKPHFRTLELPKFRNSPHSIAAASRDGVAPPVLARLCRCVPGARRHSTTIEAGYQQCRHCLLPLPTATAPPWRSCRLASFLICAGRVPR